MMIFLVGFMGSGKSTVACLVAQHLGWDSCDTDELVEAREGRSIEQIFRESGEGYFRKAEWDCLVGLNGSERLVVATGGGLFLGAEQRSWIRLRGQAVWLDVTLEECARRIARAGQRPLWNGSDALALRSMYEKRRAAYALARVRILGEGGPEEVARRVLGQILP